MYGSEKRKTVQARLIDIGKDLGINFKLGGLTANTRNSHRIIQLARTRSLETQGRVVDALFRAYFENQQDINRRDVLKAAAVKGGLDAAEVDDVLSSDKFGKQVDDEVAEAKRNLITGVPNFTLNEKYEIPGAQDSAGFLRVFEKIKELEG